jgi:hypothetical protein
MNQPLHTWKLIPTGIPSALWYLSSARTPIRVRAAGPFEARELAAQRFGQPEPAHQLASESPWLDPDLVHCFEDHDERLASLPEPGIVTE